jgi:hypothetical protein
MASEWTPVDTFVRDLGVLRSVATQVRVNPQARTVIETAIREAAHAIDLTIDAPLDRQRLDDARAALQVCSDVIVALDHATARSHHVRGNAATPSDRARQLIAEAAPSHS